MSANELHLRSVTWDEKTKAAYIEFRKGKIKQTLETSVADVPIIVSIDVDKDRNLLGVEILAG